MLVKFLSIPLFTLLLFVSIDSNAEIYPYVGFSLGESSTDDDCGDDSNLPEYYECEGTATANKIFGGVRLNKNIAIEASYMDMGKLTKTINNISRITAESKGTNLSLLGIIPASEFIEFFGKVGLLYWNTSTSGSGIIDGSVDDNGTDISFGIGLSLGNDRYAFRAEFERLNKLGDEYNPGGPITIGFIGGVIYF